ncbi:uncharacterized protein A4U43_C02F18140 [Asparagus officinalis]|uniref:Uncharacterized protein n=1 Tax=Asparagus officinalis TaxID=4686 RepID=A0A5P1FLT8_ASPOF|nr:uncharacterized protein A4U43_C02F18140 [Asparagus officinalis]
MMHELISISVNGEVKLTTSHRSCSLCHASRAAAVDADADAVLRIPHAVTVRRRPIGVQRRRKMPNYLPSRARSQPQLLNLASSAIGVGGKFIKDATPCSTRDPARRRRRRSRNPSARNVSPLFAGTGPHSAETLLPTCRLWALLLPAAD